MPSIMTLEGPRFGAAAAEYGQIIAIKSVSDTPKPPPPPPPTTQRTTLGPRGRGRGFRGAEDISFGRLALISLGAMASTLLAMKLLGPKPRRALRGPSMLSTIAKESRSPAEFARRAEAWNASLPARDRYGMTNLAKAYKKASPAKVKRLIREAYEARTEGRERLWSRMSRGLR